MDERFLSKDELTRLLQKRERDRLPTTYRWVKVREGATYVIYMDEQGPGGIHSDGRIVEKWEGPVWEIQRPLPTPDNPNAYEAVGRVEATYHGGFRYACQTYINLLAPGSTFHTFDGLYESGQQVICRYEKYLTERVGAQVEMVLEKEDL